MARLWQLKMTGAATVKGTSKTFRGSLDKTRIGLAKQLVYWKANKGQGIETRNLWFKKQKLTEDYQLKVKMQTSSVFPDEAHRAIGKPYFYPIAENDMESVIEELIAEIDKDLASGDDEVSDPKEQTTKILYEEYKVLEKAKAARKAAKAKSV